MGASSWQYFVPYQTDMYKALLELRRQVFESGDYHEPYLQPISEMFIQMGRSAKSALSASPVIEIF